MVEQDIYYATNQTHPTYDDKLDIWKLISDSYAGGQTYMDGDYLHKFTLRESDLSYTERKKRAVFFNNVQPLADMLTGFLFTNDVIRTDYKQDELIERASRTQNIDNFMQMIAVNSLMYTVGVLIDSPSFDTEFVRTEADRKNLNLNAYAVMYQPWQIRNYYCDENDSLQWVILDNTYYDNADPYKKAKYVISYRLWTKDYFQDFISIDEIDQIENLSANQTLRTITTGQNFQASEQVPHPVGEVPFVFANWHDRTTEKVQDTIFEDIGLFDQAVYNYMSLLDEMLVGGTFKYLFYPGTVPKELEAQSFSNYAVIPFPDATPHKPFFDGPTLSDTTPFLQAMEFYLSGILKKLGLDTDATKNYVQSGAAKFFDFTKTRALLASGASSMEEVEKEIFRLSGLWMGIDDTSATIEYKKDFLGEEMQQELERLYNMLTALSSYPKVKEHAVKRIVDLSFDDSVSEKEMEEIRESIEEEIELSEETRENARLNIANMAQQQQSEEQDGPEQPGTEGTEGSD